METIIKNAKLGDGSLYIPKSNINAYLSFTSKNLDWIKYKYNKCEEIELILNGLGKQKSGYTGRRDIHKFETRVDERLTKAYYTSMEEVISNLTKEDLVHWFLDDGSYHINKNTMHLYSNMLNEKQTELLIERITNLYNIDPRKRVDRKKDGRKYFYLYFRRKMVEVFKYEVYDFLKRNNIKSLVYKTGMEW